MIFVSILSLFLITSISCSNVHHLNQNTWESYIKSHPLSIITIVAPWCQRSQDLGLELELASNQISSVIPEFVPEIVIGYGKIDLSESPNLVLQTWKVVSVPTTIMIINDKVIKYRGERNHRSITDWVLRSIPPIIKTLRNRQSINKILDVINSPLYVIDSPDSSFISSIEKISDPIKNISIFTYVNDEESQSKLHVYRQGEGNYKSLNGLSDTTAVKDFIKHELYPLVGRLSSDTYLLYMNYDTGDIKYPTVWFIGNLDQFNSVSYKLYQAANAFRIDGTIEAFFVWIPESLAPHAWTSLAVADTPTLIFQSMNRNLFEFPSSVVDAEVAEIVEFIKRSKNNSAEKKHRSESLTELEYRRITEKVDEGTTEVNKRPSRSVKSIVSRNFKLNVYDNVSDALIAVLAPIGLINRKMEDAIDGYGDQIYSESIELQKNLKLFKIDGTRNDLKQFLGFEVTEFPSLFYVRKSQSNLPIRYSCPATVEAISMFVDRALIDELLPTLI